MRSQCESPRINRAVLRGRKEALGSPASKEELVKVGCWFQSDGPIRPKTKAHVLSIQVLAAGQGLCRSSERDRQREVAEDSRRIRSLHQSLTGIRRVDQCRNFELTLRNKQPHH